MWRYISGRALWSYLMDGLLLYGASAGGSTQCYMEVVREREAAARAAAAWDWSVPNEWYDVAHRD